MKKLLCVLNTCEIGGRSNVPWYQDTIRSLLFQTIAEHFKDDYKIVVSGCKMTDQTKGDLQRSFADLISYNWVEENLPLSVTFNDTVYQCVKRFGEFEGYLYIDSGISFWDSQPVRVCPHCNKQLAGYTAIQGLWNVFKNTGDSVCAAFPSNDDGGSWWGLNFKVCEDHRIPLGKATNMHCQIFPEEWRKTYGHILPDIFASNCMESVFAGMASAIKKLYVMTTKIHIQHLHSLDGASIGSRQPDPDRHPMSKMFDTGGLLFKSQRTIDDMYRDGKHLGFGIEECKDYWRHDPAKFDKDGFAIEDELKDFYKKEMFLPQELFDYSKIKRIWIPGR